ncbi:LysR family transcriptional regulator [Phyllobacterium myrsinacearum]|uniref:DNA-binding transcriptional LysR family regulator n=1 Tax=Phyllobacterium myrsinacearum TaxID=28101 RepID=A0A839EQX1_9HYPH|nr:LysR family transcriptional regulator [Phyllobacterium myrsinacearum]MBA8879000.1 DNA-binding transcriptional LysR family regulator [Phyllobacterium myrsinacearum]
MRITLRHIEVFQAVMASRTVTGAAVLLKTSQPTVSRELKRLEMLTGFTLFDRSYQQLVPTARGLMLYEEVKRSFLGLHEIMQTVEALRLSKGEKIAVTCQPALSQSLLPRAIGKLLSRFPDARIDIDGKDPRHDDGLRIHQYDLGLIELIQGIPGAHSRHLGVFPMVCILSQDHVLASKSCLEPSDFTGQPFVCFSQNDPYRKVLDRIFEARGINRNVCVETKTAASACSLVRENIGMAIINPLTALDFASQGLAVRRFSVEVPFHVAVVQPNYKPTSVLVEAMADALQDVANEYAQRLKVLGLSVASDIRAS